MQTSENKLAIIDCGTNTFNLIMACRKDQSFHILHQEKRAVKLGEGGIANGIITPAAIERAIAAMREYKSKAIEFNCTTMQAYGTAALRSAKNSTTAKQQIEQATGISITLIDGNTEAEWIHLGVMHDHFFRSKNVMIMDIGGGSTEFIISNNYAIKWKQSFALGAALLLDQFKPESQITLEQIEILHQHFDDLLKPLFENLDAYKPDVLIGSAGSFETFASMIELGKGARDVSDDVLRHLFNMEELNLLHQKLINSTLQQRLTMPGLWPPRADMIVLASILFKYVRSKYIFSTYYMTHYSLREGILCRLFQLD